MNQDRESDDLFRRASRPLLIIISGPSGVGKDTVVQRMKERGYPFYFVITATDRLPRPGEVDGRDYYFYTTAEFERMIAQGELLEHACVYGQHKGIPRAHVQQALECGQDVVLRVDVQGAAKIKALIQEAVTIFLTVESMAELEARLRERRSEPDAELQKRLDEAQKELDCIPDFDYVVLNRRCALDATVDDVVAIMRAEHCRAVPRRISL